MRKLFVCPLETWHEAHRRQLFHPVAGSHYISHSADMNPLPNGMIIVAAVFSNEESEEAFLAMKGVAALPHPTLEGHVSMSVHRDNPKTAYVKHHHEALKAIGIDDWDTVLQVSKKTAAMHPLVKIKHIM